VSPPRRLVAFVQRDPGATVLVVTNMWPEPDQGRPVYGIFVQRQTESLRAAGVRCDVLYIRGYRSFLAYPLAALRFALSSVTWRRRYRLLHVHAGEAALAARFHLGTPMLVTYHGDDIVEDPGDTGIVPLTSRVRHILVRAHSRLFRATIVQSRQMYERLPATTRRRSAVIPVGVDAGQFIPLDRDDCRARLEWEPGEFVALFAGTKPDSSRKRRHLAESACRLASNGAGSVRLHVAGTVPPDEMPKLMNAADCLLMTSTAEGSPCVVKEAMMCNLPVISTDVGDVVERLEGVEPSWVCPADPQALADALSACAVSRKRSNGREKADELDERRIAERILALYRKVAGEDVAE
jgi:glycosyltransferase involved in cell wall biosynthesis